MAKKTKLTEQEAIKRRIGPICEKHKPMNTQLGYVAWHDWADKKTKLGHVQKECPDCLRLFFKCEM